MHKQLAAIAALVGCITLAGPAGAQNALTCAPWTDNPIVSGQTPIRADHINELRTCLELVLDVLRGSPPPPPPGASCTDTLGTVTGPVTRTGSWDAGCPSAHFTDGRLARYYSFTLDQSASVTINLSSSVDTYLVLRNGAGTGTGVVEIDDDGGSGTNSRISRTLASGTYTIEATTYFGGSTGSFTLALDVSGGGGGVGGKQVTVSNVIYGVGSSGLNYGVTFDISNTGSEAVDGFASYVRFYDASGTLLDEEDDFQLVEVPFGESLRLEHFIPSAENDRLGWTYFLLSFTDRNVAVPCVGCDVHNPPPLPPGPCGAHFEEGIAVTQQCSRGGWWAAGPVQDLLTCWDTEEEALDLVTFDDGLNLERIGSADYRRRTQTVTGTRLWRTGNAISDAIEHPGGPSDNIRSRLSRISCLR